MRLCYKLKYALKSVQPMRNPVSTVIRFEASCESLKIPQYMAVDPQFFNFAS